MGKIKFNWSARIGVLAITVGCAPTKSLAPLETSPLHVQRRGALPAPEPGAAHELISSSWNARPALGVDDLIRKHPTADGRGVKIAIFDTGISTQIAGLEPKKIFDLSDFGRLKTSPLPPGTSTQFRGVRPPLITGESWLYESELARAAAQSRGVDANQNGRVDDAFYVLVGENEKGEKRIWIDFDRDGFFDRPREELGDYNSGFRADSSLPLALSIFSDGSLQFHLVLEGHGTACASVIRGSDSRPGLAPAAELYSYVLDPAGENLNSIEDLLKIFIHARDEGVDLINVSWNFTTADLASARFFADFIDREIIGAGVGVAFAVGNEGPGAGTAGAADYIPHLGFGIGASVLPDLARSIYGWSGDIRSGDAWFSSRGPTRGGRVMPDLVAPYTNLVRSADPQNPALSPFDGTSSATPAFVGAVAALRSLLQQRYREKINALAFKQALQNSAELGLPHMGRALDIYERLRSEDPGTTYQLRAETVLPGEALMGEGVRLSNDRDQAEVFLRVLAQDASNKPLYEDLELRLESDFFEAPTQILIQGKGAGFRIATQVSKVAAPGLYSDTLSVRRKRDGLEILKIPVSLEIPPKLSLDSNPIEISTRLGPHEILRRHLQLKQRQSLHFSAQLQELDPAASGHLVVFVRDAQGTNVFKSFSPLRAHAPQVQWSSPELAAGNYEISIFRIFNRGARLKASQVHATLRGPALRIMAQEQDAAFTSLSVEAQSDLSFERAELSFHSGWAEILLRRQIVSGREVFAGDLKLADKTAVLSLQLEQSNFDASAEAMLSTEMTLWTSLSKRPLFRGWVALSPGLLQNLYLQEASDQIRIEAYPNIVNWNKVRTQNLKLRARSSSERPGSLTLRKSITLQAGQRTVLRFLNASRLDDGATPTRLEVFDGDGQSLESLPFDLR